MKKRFTILAAAFALLAFLAIPMGMRGQTTVTFTAGTDTGETSVTKDGVTVSMSTMSRTDNYRCYANTDMTIVSTAGNITSVELTCTGSGDSNYGPGKFSLTEGNTGSYSYSGYIGTWIGSAADISLSASSQVRMTEIVVTIGGSVPTTYTVTYNCNGGTSGCPENVTGITAGTSITLAAAPTKTDFTFDGWDDGTTTYQAGANYTVNGNVTMTAQWTEIVSGDEQWVLTNLADLTEDDVFVIVGNNGSNYAMSNNNGTGGAPSAVAVTVTDNEITSTVSPTIKWTISGNATDGYTFYPNGDTENWLYCTATNNGVRVGVNTANIFNLEATSGYLVHQGTSRYIGIYNSQDWRCYTSINTNIQNQTFAFYKKVTGGVLPPSITADDVDIAYDATSGYIAYTINNTVTGGTVSVAAESDWLTLGQGTTSPISFTCTANEGAAERTAIVTLTYTYERATATANVTVTQAGNPNIIDNISDITATGTSYAVRGTVVAVNAVGFVIGDGTGYVYTYLNSVPEVAVGDIKKISGTMGSYNHVLQFTNTAAIVDATNSNYNNTPVIQVLDATGIGTYSEDLHLSDYVQVEGMLTISGNFYNITVDGLTTSASISYPTDEQKTEMAGLENKHVIVKGYFAGVSGGHFNVLLGTIEEVVSTEPSITIPNATVNNVPAEGAEGTLTVYYENIEEMVANVYFCDAEGAAASYNWIYAEVDDDNNLSYTIDPNDGEARTAYLKVYEGNTNTYSNLVTINQAAYVAPTYAELPFSFDGGKEDIEGTDGLYQEGLGSDYSTDNTKLKFDHTGDWLLLQFNERPGTLTFNIKNNSFSGGTFKVQTSEDGVTYTDLAIYTEITDTQDEEFSDLGENVRYIKWIYTNKASGNVGLGNIALQPYVAPQEYTLTVSGLNNVELYVFDASDENQAIIEGEGSAQVLNGTTIEISVSAIDGCVLQSLMVDGVDVTSQIDETGAYTFTMPTHNVTVTATAIEYVAGGDYVRISSLDQLTDGRKVIIAARYDEDHTNGYYAMPGETSGKPTGVAFTSETSGTDEILPATITAFEDTYYWTVNVTENGYTFTNANGQVIGYGTSGTDFSNGNNAHKDWTIARETSDETAMVAGYTGFVVTNVNTDSRAFAFNGEKFGAYAKTNMTAPGYNFFLDFFVQTETSETVTQTIELAAGTNWVSFNVDITLDDLKSALLAADNSNGIVINSQTEGITTWNGRAWRGDLNTLDVNQMYMIDVPVACEITLESMPVDPTGHPYDIAIGSNWIGFPLSESMTLTDAFASIAVQNDQVTSQNDGFSNFNGRMWRGNLGQLVPGQGYIYDSSHQATFVFPMSTSKFSRKAK